MGPTDKDALIKGYRDDWLESERKQKELRQRVQEQQLTLDKIKQSCDANSVVDSRKILYYLEEYQYSILEDLRAYARRIWPESNVEIYYNPEAHIAAVRDVEVQNNLLYIQHPYALTFLATTLRAMFIGRGA